MLAASKGELEMCEYLIKTGTCSEKELNSCLMYVMWSSNYSYDAVKLLIDYGADVNSKTSSDYPILHLAIAHNDVECAKLLFENGADPLLTNSLNQTAIEYAESCRYRPDFQFLESPRTEPQSIFTTIKSGDLNTLSKFLEKDTNKIYQTINNLNKKDETPLAYAAQLGHFEIVKYLTQLGADVCKTGPKGETPLVKAVANGNLEMCRYLLKEGANLTMNTALVFAIQKQKLDVVKLLVENGADLNRQDKNGNTLLTEAILSKNFDILTYLVEKDADISICNKQGQTFLELALDINFKVAVELLLEKETNPNLVLSDGSSLLTRLIKSNQFNFVKLLVDKCADINKADANCNFPINLALVNPNQEILDFFLKHKIDLSNAKPNLIIDCMKSGNHDVIKKLIKNGLDPNLKTEDTKTLLHEFISSFDIEMVELLVENGANVNIPDRNGTSPLEKALEFYNFRLFKILAESKNANLEIKIRHNQNLLSIAAKKMNFRIVNYLIERGLNVNTAMEDLVNFAKTNEDFSIYFNNLKKKQDVQMKMKKLLTKAQI